ncbi:T9SS type A sorting domain-containing protein [Lewinella sp. LCG006]|uniref:T9SS type A sorting domain-containing protein n=1 Tax=Lewinella sp. LCG006 TaxID=3231911 RepID=UPI00345F5B1B
MIARNILLLVFTAFLSFLNMPLIAQGWEEAYNGPNDQDAASDVLLTSDGNYIGLGRSGAAFSGLTQVIKTDPNGVMLWQQTYGSGVMNMNAIINTTDGGYAMAGHHYTSPTDNGIALVKLDAQGNMLWLKDFACCTDLANDVIQTPDGGYLIVGLHPQAPYAALAIKTDANGDEVWSNSYYEMTVQQFFLHDGFRRVVMRDNGNYLMIGSLEGTLRLTEIDDLGTEVWDTTLNNPQIDYLEAGDLEITNDGGILVAASRWANNQRRGGFLWKFDANRNELWTNFTTTLNDGAESLSENAAGELFIGRRNLVEKRDANGNLICQLNENGDWNWKAVEVEATTDGGAIAATTLAFSTFSNLALAKMDDACVASVHAIAGNVNLDADGDCIFNGAGQNLQNWIVEMKDGAVSYYDFTDANGNYFFPISPGIYTLTLHPPMSYWGTCAETLPVLVGNTPDTVYQDLQGTLLEECPYLYVDLASPPMRPCVGKNASVYYENFGTATAENASIIISLDPLLSITTASMPFTSLAENQYEFLLGDLDPGVTGGIIFEVLTDCDAELGQELCLQANIYPDTLCGDMAWMGAVIDVQGDCSGENIDFKIKNIGQANMVAPLEFIVVEDEVMYMQGEFDLGVGETYDIMIPNTHSTYIAQAEQEPGYPNGNFAIDVVAFCQNPNLNNPFSTGFINQFPLNNATPSEDIECVEVVNSYDPNRKVATPTGYGPDHLIEANTLLEYQIDFQNTGTDTAFNIVIRDTLSSFLDITSFRRGASSHSYDVQLEGSNVLVFSFPNINLVDSIANEPLSHGFVEYRITPKNDVANGTVIENSAAIYFDFNPPIITNTTWYTIGEAFILVAIDAPYQETLSLEVYPNPATPNTKLRLKGAPSQNTEMKLFNAQGQKVAQASFYHDQFPLGAMGLAKGVYFFQIWSEGAFLGSGKLIIQ